MSDVKINTTTGKTVSLPEDTIEKFKSSLHGTLLGKGDPGYDEARPLWNAMIDRKPALIARCTGTADVMTCVKFAREHNLLVSVRGGGHNIAGLASADDSLMIDLSLLRSVHVDPAAQTAAVGPGATLGDLDHETQAFGFATPVGINSTTGVAGLTLGGGFGWLSRKYGLSIDNLISADIVTADGKLVKASEKENSDLFWGIRGGGGNFGIVTSFEFRLHKVGPEVLAGLIIHPLDAAGDVLRFYRDFIKTTPEEFVCWFVMRLAPPAPFLPVEWHGKEILGLAVCYSGNVSDGERIAKPLRDFGKPIADVVAPAPFAAWQTVLDHFLTPGARNYWKSHDFTDVSDGLIDALVTYARKIPDPQSEIAFAQLGGAVSKVAQDATAYGHRDGQFVMNVHGRWDKPENDEKCISWARDLFKATASFATGSVYVNFLTQDEHERLKLAYGINYDRLVQVKKKYDPTNFFRTNHNIKPA